MRNFAKAAAHDLEIMATVKFGFSHFITEAEAEEQYPKGYGADFVVRMKHIEHIVISVWRRKRRMRIASISRADICANLLNFPLRSGTSRMWRTRRAESGMRSGRQTWRGSRRRSSRGNPSSIDRLLRQRHGVARARRCLYC